MYIISGKIENSLVDRQKRAVFKEGKVQRTPWRERVYRQLAQAPGTELLLRHDIRNERDSKTFLRKMEGISHTHHRDMRRKQNSGIEEIGVEQGADAVIL